MGELVLSLAPILAYRETRNMFEKGPIVVFVREERIDMVGQGLQSPQNTILFQIEKKKK